VATEFETEANQTVFDALYIQNTTTLLLNRMCQKKSALGYGIISVRKVNDEVILRNIPVKNYFPDTDGLPVGSTTDDIKRHYVISVV
jgi:hypothetical protein